MPAAKCIEIVVKPRTERDKIWPGGYFCRPAAAPPAPARGQAGDGFSATTKTRHGGASTLIEMMGTALRHLDTNGYFEEGYKPIHQIIFIRRAQEASA